MESEQLAWYMRQLEARPAWAGLPAGEREGCIRRAAEVGRTCAVTSAPVPCPLTWAQTLEWSHALGVAVAVIAATEAGADRRVRAVYDRDAARIEVQERSVAELVSAVPGTPWEAALTAHVAHELFHCLEAAGKVPASRYLRPKRWPPVSVAVLREIAAHEFAEAVSGCAVPLAWLVIGGPGAG